MSTRLSLNQAEQIARHVLAVKNNESLYISLLMSKDNKGYFVLITQNNEVASDAIDALVARTIPFAREKLGIEIDRTNFAVEYFHSRKISKPEPSTEIKPSNNPAIGLHSSSLVV